MTVAPRVSLTSSSHWHAKSHKPTKRRGQNLLSVCPYRSPPGVVRFRALLGAQKYFQLQEGAAMKRVSALLTLGEVERVTRRKTTTLRNDIRAGRLKIIRLGRQVRVTEEALREFISGKPLVSEPNE